MTLIVKFFFIVFFSTSVFSQTLVEGHFLLYSKEKKGYHFCFKEGSLVYPMIIYDQEQHFIESIYYSDSSVLNNISTSFVKNNPDSLIAVFKNRFVGSVINLSKKSKIDGIWTSTSRGEFWTNTDGFKISLYPNGRPYAIFYSVNQSLIGTIVYFKRNGEIMETIDLSTCPEGHEITLRNMHDYRERKKFEKYRCG